MAPIGLACRLSKGTSPTQKESSCVIEPEIKKQLARVRRDVPKGQYRFPYVVG